MAKWYLGPLGDLRELPTPEPNIAISEVRYGGVFQGLSGARTIDVTGHRADYEFEWVALERADWKWLYALHTRHIPGPFRLINPLRRNRLTPQATKLDPTWLTGVGMEVPSAAWEWDWSFPAEADPGVRSVQLTSWSGDNTVVRFDKSKPTAVFPGETVTASVYLKADVEQTVELVLDHYDRTGHIGASTREPVTVTPQWQRFTITRTAPAGVPAMVFAMLTGPVVSPINIAAPQFESGSVATEWEQGGGAPVVLIDQLVTSSPRFPLMDCRLTLLEA